MKLINKMFKVKILKVPDLNPLNPCSTKVQAPYMPPLNIATITAYLRQRGIYVEQDDLNIKFYYDEYYYNKNRNLKIIDSLKNHEIVEYIKTKSSNKLKNIVESILAKTKLENIDLLLLSGDIHWVSIFSTYIKSKHKLYIGSNIGLNIENITKFHRLLLKNRRIDFFINGPGEEPANNIIEKLRSGLDIKNTKGLVYFRDNKIIINKMSEPVLPVKPDFKGLPLEKYAWNRGKKFSHWLIKRKDKKILVLPFRLMIGCPYECTFCTESGDKKFLFLKPEIVVEYLKELSKEYNTKFFFFMDDTINFSKKYINDVCDEIIKNKLEIFWTDCASFRNLDEKTLKNMRSAGCISLIFGLETGSQRLLDYIDKGVTTEHASNCLQLAHEQGIWTGIEIITGFPTEQKEDIKKTISFIKSNSKYINNAFYSGFFIAKNSLFWKYPNKYGLTNIRKLEDQEKFKYSRISYLQYAFDEINGLSWQEKNKQINHSYSETRFGSPIIQKYLNYEQMPFLFSLYDLINNKQQIQKINNKVMQRIYRSFILDPKHIKRYIFEIMTIKELFKKIKYFLH